MPTPPAGRRAATVRTPPPGAHRHPRRWPCRASSASSAKAGTSPPPPWRCPVCGLPLLPAGGSRSIACASNHSYDVAKEGYVNLMRAGRLKKASAAPAGDGAAAYAARQRVFAAGVFDDVMAAAADAVAAAAAGGGTVLDLGCGEGSYAAALAARGLDVRGVDVGKDAVRAAAKRLRSAGGEGAATARHPRVAVASSFDVPLPDACLAAALVAFAPFPAAELGRLLAPGAAVVVVRPGPTHLAGLKALVYGPAAAPRARPPPPRSVRVMADLDLGPEVGGALLAMTPYAWSDAKGGQKAAAVVAAEGLRTPLDVVVETVGGGEVAGWGGGGL